MDEVQQYSPRDCLEVVGIPVSSNEDPNVIVQEIADLVGVALRNEDISIAHRLPDSKNKKNR